MPFSSTAKRVQRVVELAETTYERITDLHERMTGLIERVERIDERLTAMERSQRDQRALLDTIAAEQGLDPDAITAAGDPDASPPSEPAPTDGDDASQSADEADAADS